MTSMHEAGHVVLQELFFPGEQYQVDVIKVEGLANGKTTPPPKGWRKRESEEDKKHDLLKALGGIAAESIEANADWYNVVGAAKDLEAACITFALLKFQRGKGGNADRIRSCLSDPKTELASYYDSTKAVLLQNWSSVKKVAEKLLSENSMTAEEVRKVLSSSG